MIIIACASLSSHAAAVNRAGGSSLSKHHLFLPATVCLVWRVFEEVCWFCKHTIHSLCSFRIQGGTLWSVRAWAYGCACFLFSFPSWTWHPSLSLSGVQRRRPGESEPESDGTPIASTWVMNYSLSSCLAVHYHRACQSTALTAVTAPRTHFPLTTHTFLIRSLPVPPPLVHHSSLFIYLSGRGPFPLFPWLRFTWTKMAIWTQTNIHTQSLLSATHSAKIVRCKYCFMY